MTIVDPYEINPPKYRWSINFKNIKQQIKDSVLSIGDIVQAKSTEELREKFDMKLKSKFEGELSLTITEDPDFEKIKFMHNTLEESNKLNEITDLQK